MLSFPRSAAVALLCCVPAGPAISQQAAAPPASSPPLTIREALSIAERQSPALEIARRERNIALIAAERARPAFRPEVTATAAQLLRTPRVDLPGRPDEVVLPNSVSRFEIGVTQPLYQFGAGKAPGIRSGAMAAAARSDFRTAELDLILEVEEAYLGIRRAQSLESVARRGLELAKENLRLTQLLIERGFQSEADRLEAERAAAEAESREVSARMGAALARANLNRLLGREVDTPFSIAAGPRPDSETEPLGTLLRRALAQRPEVDAMRQNILAAEAGVRLARSSGKPRVSLEALYALQTETALVPRSGFAAGVSISVPVFSGAVRSHTIHEAEERVAQLKSALLAREQGIALEIERQRLARADATARSAAAERAVIAAQKAFDIVVLRLDRGHATQAESLNSRLGLERALADREGAANDLLLAGARLRRAVGEPATANPVESQSK